MSTPRSRLPFVTAAALVLLVPATARSTVLPTGRLDVTLVSGGFKACAVAKADPTLNVLREWAFAVSGFGFDGSVIAPTPETSSGLSFTPSCVYVFKGSAPGGQFAATVTYGGAGVDAVLVLAGTGTWGPLGDHVSGMERP